MLSSKETLISIVRVLGLVLFVLALGASFILWQQWNAKRQQPSSQDSPKQPASQEATDQSKKAILESLSAPQDVPQDTNEEKKQILEELSAPPTQSAPSDEEKKKILESLSAPNQ